nr:hypothetical protein [Pseudomonas sp. Marseille-Q3773]
MSKEDYSLWLVGGTALLVAEAAQGLRQYVLDSILFAQLRADKVSGSRFTHYGRWYSEYRTALEERGWVILRSSSDHQRMQPGHLLVPAERLTDDLLARYPRLSGHLRAAITLLSQGEPQQHLQPFTLAEHDQTTHCVYELGVVLPDGSLDVCGLAFKSSLPVSQVHPCTRLEPSATEGIDLRISAATLSEHLSGAHFQELHDLLERTQHDGKIRNLGVLKPEHDDAKT